MSAREVPVVTNYPVSPSAWTISHRHFVWKMVGVAVAISAAPLVLLGIWVVVRNWGAWKVVRPGPGPHYIRTWHGWVEAEKDEEGMLRKRRRKRENSPFCRGRTSPTAEHTWIFWDPTGEKKRIHDQRRQPSILRYPFPWTSNDGNRSAAPDRTKAPNSFSTAEEGRFSYASPRRDANR